MDNRAGEMEVFVRAVRLGSFSAASRQLGLSPSAVSKLITRIEDRLGARLLVRSTRALQLTPEGEVYLERAGRILGEIEEAERVVTSGGSAVPRGPLRVSASVAFGASHIVPHMAEFLALYPGIELDLSLTDSVIDLYQERADVAIRSGKLRDSSLVARKILEIRRVVVASPAYLERHGTPQVPAELAAHNCLRFNFLANRDEWIFRDPETGENFAQRIGGNMLGNNGPTLRRLCLDGLGLIRSGRFQVERDITEGRLVPVLERFNPRDIETIHAVFAGHGHLAARIRAFIDFLADKARS